MHARSHHITTIAIVIVAACTGDSSTAPSGDGSAGSVLVRPPATPVRLEVSPYKATTLRGMSIFPYLFQVMSDSTRIPVIARWTSTDKRVIDVDAGTGYAIAIGPGEASIRAEANDLVAAAAIAVQDPTPIDPGDALIVDSFSVIELQAQPGWFYVPQMRAHAASGGSVYVVQWQIFLPGLGGANPAGCGARLTDVARDLNGIGLLGDWNVGIGSTRQVTGDQAAAIVVFADDAGHTTTRVVRGAIVSATEAPDVSGNGACYTG